MKYGTVKYQYSNPESFNEQKNKTFDTEIPQHWILDRRKQRHNGVWIAATTINTALLWKWFVAIDFQQLSSVYTQVYSPTPV